jgi:hypothetical protein
VYAPLPLTVFTLVNTGEPRHPAALKTVKVMLPVGWNPPLSVAVSVAVDALEAFRMREVGETWVVTPGVAPLTVRISPGSPQCVVRARFLESPEYAAIQ